MIHCTAASTGVEPKHSRRGLQSKGMSRNAFAPGNKQDIAETLLKHSQAIANKSLKCDTLPKYHHKITYTLPPHHQNNANALPQHHKHIATTVPPQYHQHIASTSTGSSSPFGTSKKTTSLPPVLFTPPSQKTE